MHTDVHITGSQMDFKWHSKLGKAAKAAKALTAARSAYDAMIKKHVNGPNTQQGATGLHGVLQGRSGGLPMPA